MPENDKRESKRIGVATTVKYRVVFPFHKKGEIKNISKGGISFIASERIAPGSVIYLEFDLPDEKGGLAHMETVGEVRWQQLKNGQYATGVKFIK